MSHSWSVRAYAGISTQALQELQRVIKVLLFAWWLAYDNVNFAFQVTSQTLKNQSHFDSGTVGSVFIKPHATPKPPLSSKDLQDKRRIGRLDPISLDFITQLEVSAAPRIHSHKIHTVLTMLLDCPGFDYPTYAHYNHPAFTPHQDFPICLKCSYQLLSRLITSYFGL